MARREDIVAAAQSLLGAEPEGLTIEALTRAVGKQIGQLMPPAHVASALQSLPQRFVQGDDGRWRLRSREVEEDAAGEPESTQPATPHLRRGCYVVFDLEALGQDPRAPANEIIQIAARRVIDGQPQEPWSTLVRPAAGTIPAQITALTGIASTDVADAPPAAEALRAFFAYVGDLPLIAHNGAGYDGPLIEATCKRLGIPLPPSFFVLDTLPLARALLPDLTAHRVGSLADYFGCAQPGAHQADVDVAMLVGIVRGLEAELGRDVTGAAVCELLRHVGDPWTDLLNPPPCSPSAAEVVATFGQRMAPLLPDRDPLVDAQSRREFVSEVEAAFMRAEALGRARREPQLELARMAARAFGEDGFAVIEAGTGTGKSLGYLVPAALEARTTGRPVAVSTLTRVLQTQLVQRELPFMQELIPGLTYAMLQGRANYLSLSRLAEELEAALEEDRITPAHAWLLGCLTRFGAVSAHGNLDALGLIPQSLDEYLHADGAVLQLLDSVRVSADDRPPRAFPDFYRRARANAGRADIVVINHALLFGSALEGGEDIIASRVVCDEAHTLEDAATLALERRIAEPTLRRLVRAIHDPRRRAGLVAATRRASVLPTGDPLLHDLADAADRLHAALDALAGRLHDYATRQAVIAREDLERYGVRVRIDAADVRAAGGPAIRDAAAATERALGDMRATLEQLIAAIAVDPQAAPTDARLRRRHRLIHLARSLLRDLVETGRAFRWFWSFGEAGVYVRMIELRPPNEANSARSPVVMIGAPINVGPLLWARLWSRLDAVVCTSATLVVAGQGFDFFLGRIGLEDVRIRDAGRLLLTCELPHPFDYHRSALLMLPDDLPAPRDTDLKRNFPRAVADLLRGFIPFFKGRTLVLFTANQRRDTVYEEIAQTLVERGFTVLCQGHGSLPQLIDDFRNEETASLLGSRSLWEGVDVPGPSLSYVMLEKLPYPSLGNPLEAARMAAVADAGCDPFYDYLLPKMIVLLKQGFGRLIRAADDRGAVILLDKRLRNAMYRPEVLRSLPDPEIGWESGVDLYRRIAAWMGIDYDPAELPQPTVSDVGRAILENTLDCPFVPEGDFEMVAKPRLLAVQRAIWGQDTFREGQEPIMRAVLAGKDVLTLLPTGAGKSRTYQLPALIRPGLTLVISPLIALIRDQVEKLREVAGMTYAAALVSGMDAASQEDVLHRAADGRVRLLYVSPERLRDPRFQSYLPGLPLLQLVVDEAHCISTWGHDFRPDFLEIVRLLRRRPGEVSGGISCRELDEDAGGVAQDPASTDTGAARLPVHALTATATGKVQEEILRRLEMGADGRAVERYSGSFVRPNLIFRLHHVKRAADREALAVGIVHQLVHDQERGGAGVVYVATRRAAEQLARLLRHRNIAAQPYHGGMPTAQRYQIQELFMQGELQVVVATNAFGMGVDKAEIRFVLHYDHPESLEAYAQEAGRAGRDGKDAYAILLAHSQTQRVLRFIARNGVPQPAVLRDYRRALDNADVALPNAAHLPDGALLCDPDELAGLAGVEPSQARVLLYSFEEAGLLRRGADCTLEATLLLNRSPSAIIDRLDDEAQRALATQLFAATGATPDRQARYSATAFVRQTGLDPRTIDPLLVRLADRGEMLYRPFKRGVTLTTTEVLPGDGALTAIEQRFGDRYAAFEERLAAMRAYIDLRPDGRHCRSAFLVDYLTGRTDAPLCGACDLCSPSSAGLPYDPGILYYGEPMRVDPYLAILGAVRDHDGWFGRWTLEHMLLGVPQTTYNGEVRPLSQAARASDHFGVLKDTGIKPGAVKAAVQALLDGAYLDLIPRQRRAGGAYEAVAITAKGRDALAGGVELPAEDATPEPVG